MSAAGVVFLAVLFTQGQILRIAKNVRDESYADEFRESFASIRQGLEALQRQTVIVASDTEPTQERRTLVLSESFFAEAKQAVEQGLYYAGAVLAAIGFERAARDCAEFMGVNSELQLSAVLNELAKFDEGRPGMRESFRTLVRLRNSLIHGKFGSVVVNREEAKEIIKGFNEGALYLDGIIQQTL